MFDKILKLKSYLPGHFRQIKHYLAGQLRQIAQYFEEHRVQKNHVCFAQKGANITI